MKTFLVLALACQTLAGPAQSNQGKEVKSDISEVTVYIDGAQVTRQKSLELPSGRCELRFINLSPYIDARSIQVKSQGSLTVLSVIHQQNFLSQQSTSAEAKSLTVQWLEYEKKIKLEKTYLDIRNEELGFLKTNSSIGGANTGTSVSQLKEATTYYSEKITAIKLEIIERESRIEDLTKEMDKINNQLKTLTEKKDLPSGEILVNVDVKTAGKAAFELKYMVGNAGWFPSYDIRVKTIDLPANLTYKANVHQNTREDWKNVKLKFSSSDPKSSGYTQELATYFLNYNSFPPSYKGGITQVSGYVYDKVTQEPVPGASVVIKGSSIGTITDMNGYYSISVPPQGASLVFSFVGLVSKECPVSNASMNIVLEEDIVSINEVVVTGLGIRRQSKTLGYATENSNNPEIKLRGVSSLQSTIPLEMGTKENQTTVEFELKSSYSIPSDGKSLSIDIDNYSLPAAYQYYCAPKVDKNAYLVAQIVDWEKFNLLEGEANVFFEDTYTGKTLLNVRYMADTLSVSLGRDKSVSVDREIQKQFTTKQFLGNKKEETRSWLLTIKNNKQQAINISIMDQIPVSTLEEIEVTALKLSNGKLDNESGKINWILTVAPAEKKEWPLAYSVKYPKYRYLVIE